MKTSTKKFIVIFSIVLVVSLSIPHISLWNFGVAPVRAQTDCAPDPVPGQESTLHYKHIQQKQDPPRRCVQQYHEEDPSSSVIGARVDHELIQAGGELTIKGSVSKLCNICDGWIYTCATFTEYTCKYSKGLFKKSCKYKDCPSGLPTQLDADGKKSSANILGIVGAILTLAAAAAAIIVTAGGAAPAVLTIVGGSWGTQATIGAGMVVTSVSGTTDELTNCPDCYSVCGTTYETKAGMAPVCNRGDGLAEDVIDYRNATYSCPEGYCGKWANKEVKIEIRDPEGKPVKTDTTKTDGRGYFSYTLTAPVGDGEYTAIVSVPIT